MAIARGTGTDRIRPKGLMVTFSSITQTSIKVRVVNRRTKDYRVYEADSANEIPINAGDLTDNGGDGTHNGWQNGDVIEIKSEGGGIGHGTITLDTNTPNQTIPITGADITATNTPTRTL